MYDVITIGSATVDVFAHTESELIQISGMGVDENFLAYPTGSKILIKSLDFQVGGGGTNTAVSFSRLGLKTGFIGMLGKDANAERILGLLKDEKVDFLGRRAEGRSGYSVILDTRDDDRTILTFKGLNDKLKYSEIKLPKTRWLYISSMMGESFKAVEKLSAYAKKKGVRVAFNPSSYLAKKGLVHLKKIISNTDFLVLNREEAELILGKSDIKKLLKALGSLGPEIVAITNGKSGVHVYDSHHVYRLDANKTRVRETTGAGDAFASGFVAGLVHSDVIFAMHLGLANATSVIQHLGAKNKLLTLSAAKRMIKKNKAIHKVK